MSCQSTSVGWFLWMLMLITLLVGVAGVPTRQTRETCSELCNKQADTYYPRRCSEECSNWEASQSDNNRLDAMESKVAGLAAMESKIASLTTMTGVLLALVLILLLIVVLIFLHLNQMLPKMFLLHVLLRNKKESNAKKKESAQKNGNGGTANTGVSRLANHQSNSPQQNKRPSFTRSSLGNTDLEPHPRPFRERQPSESTCPEEGNDTTPQGYDNLGLSTSTIDASTLHNTSTDSTDTLGPAISTNTIQTTLASENSISNTHHHNTRV